MPAFSICRGGTPKSESCKRLAAHKSIWYLCVSGFHTDMYSIGKFSVRKGKIESIAHRAKDMSHLKEELKDEGEDEDLSYEYVDDEDIEDLEDFEYEEEDWEDDRK